MTKRSPSQTQTSLRRMVARRDGYSCHYCRVPTAATIEHMDPLGGGGRSNSANLRLACPFCNTRKGERGADEFIDSGDWRRDADQIPEDFSLWLTTNYGQADLVKTGSIHAQLLIEREIVYLLVRPSKKEDWLKVKLGAKDHPRVIAAAIDFLERHYAPRLNA